MFLLLIFQFPVIHVGAHCFNFENLTMSWHVQDMIELNNKLKGCHNWFRPIENGSVVSIFVQSVQCIIVNSFVDRYVSR